MNDHDKTFSIRLSLDMIFKQTAYYFKPEVMQNMFINPIYNMIFPVISYIMGGFITGTFMSYNTMI